MRYALRELSKGTSCEVGIFGFGGLEPPGESNREKNRVLAGNCQTQPQQQKILKNVARMVAFLEDRNAGDWLTVGTDLPCFCDRSRDQAATFFCRLSFLQAL